MRFLKEGEGYFESGRVGFKEYVMAISALPVAIIAILVGMIFLGVARGLEKLLKLFSGRRPS